MATQVAAGGFTFSQVSVGGTWFWTIQANNILGANQLYQVVDIITPFGKITDAAIPIPGDIITAMANCLLQFQQQLAPLLYLVNPIPPIFNLTVTEGDASSQAGIVTIQNIGAFGSFMTAVANPDVPWLSASPPLISGMNKNDQAQFTFVINPATLISSSSPYTGHINLQDNRTPPTVIPATINVTVLPRPNILLSTSSIALTWMVSLGSGGGSQQVTITNNGPAGSILNFNLAKVRNCSPWLTFTPAYGGPLAQGASAIVTFSLVTQNIPIPGTYTEVIQVVSSNASNSPQTITVTLIVTA